MNVTAKITLNLQAPDAAIVVYGVQNDKASRFVEATLLDGSVPWTPDTGLLYTIRFAKPDGTGGFYDTTEDGTPAVTMAGNVATVAYAAQVMTVPGDVRVQLQIWKATGEILTSFAWLLKVLPNVHPDEEITSSPYYNVLAEQMTAVLDAAESLTGMTASAHALATGADPTVDVTGGEGGEAYNLDFGIPRGPTGPAPTISATEIAYQASASGTTIPTGTWTTGSVPTVNPGQYLWTRVTITFSSGTVQPFYSVAYRGLNGNGAVNTVNDVQPDSAGNVALTAGNIPTDADAAVSVEDKLNSLDLALADAQGTIASVQDSVENLTPEDIGAASSEDLQGLLSRTTVSHSASAAGAGAATVTISLSRSGYTAIGIVGFNTSSTALIPARVNLNAAGTTLTAVLKNVTSTAVSGVTFYADILWVKNG